MLTKKGLDMFKTSKIPAIKLLNNKYPDIKSVEVSFRIAPIINASGRLRKTRKNNGVFLK